jgi:hypothetical protein
MIPDEITALSLEKTVKKIDEQKKNKNITVEEWPPLPDDSWKWKLSNPAKELEEQLNALIRKFLIFRKSSSNNYNYFFQGDYVKEKTDVIVPLPKVRSYYFKQDDDAYVEVDIQAVRWSILISAKSNQTRKDFITREIKRISWHVRRAAWKYLRSNKKRISMMEYYGIVYTYPEAFGMTKKPELSLADIREYHEKCNTLSTAPGSAKL